MITNRCELESGETRRTIGVTERGEGHVGRNRKDNVGVAVAVAELKKPYGQDHRGTETEHGRSEGEPYTLSTLLLIFPRRRHHSVSPHSSPKV